MNLQLPTERRKLQRSKSRDQEVNLERDLVLGKEDAPGPKTAEDQDRDQGKGQNGHDQEKGRRGHVQGTEGEAAVDPGIGEDQGHGTISIRRASMGRSRDRDERDSKKEITRDYDQEEMGYESGNKVKEEKHEAVDMEISNSP